MNAPMKKQIGPTLFLIDNDASYKAATCVGCTFAKIFDSHFVHCNVQDHKGDQRMPPMVSNWDNRGRQVINGTPNQYCPYIHRVKTWEAGKRVPRSFSEMLRDLSYERGWMEECPDEGRWYFKKKNWLVTADWNTKSFRFQNLRRK